MSKDVIFKFFGRFGFIFGLVLTLSLLWPLVYAPYFSHHDDVQPLRVYELSKCLLDGQIPCRWVPDMGDLYGFPIFNYYAPLAYYFGAIIYLLTGSLIFSVKLMFVTPFVGSYIFMYLLSRRFWGNLGGLVSAVFYSFAPYHSLVFYVRGAMGEIWSLMFFPAIFWALSRLIDSPRIINVLALSLFICLLVISHNLSAMIFLPVVIAFALMSFYRQRNLRFLKFFILSLVLGVLLSSFYLLPMLFEKNLVHVESTTSGYFSYTEHFKGLRKLLVDRFWGWGGSFREVPGGEKDGLSYQIGWAQLIAWILAIFATVKFWKKDKLVSLISVFFSAGIVLSIFMVHPRSEFVWKLIMPLRYLQFPWRFLILVIFFISFLAGRALEVVESNLKSLLVLGLLLLVVVLNFSYFRPEKFLYPSDKEFLSGPEWSREVSKAVFDFLPISAQEPPAGPADSPYQILTGQTKITDFEQGTDWIHFKADTKSHSIIRVSQYYFPQWRLLIDNQQSKIDYLDNNLGLITFLVGTGQHQISLTLLDTPIRVISNWLTLLGVFLLIILLLSQVGKTRRWIFYYLKSLNR